MPIKKENTDHKNLFEWLIVQPDGLINQGKWLITKNGGPIDVLELHAEDLSGEAI